VNALAAALVTNKLSLNSLTYLNLSGNTLREEVQSLVDFLAQPNVVSILDLSSTDVPSELLFGALVRGCTVHLTHLNLARNPFAARKSSKDAVCGVTAAFKQFFATTQVLKYLNMSHGKLPVEALKALLLGLACNENTADVELNISRLVVSSFSVVDPDPDDLKCMVRIQNVLVRIHKRHYIILFSDAIIFTVYLMTFLYSLQRFGSGSASRARRSVPVSISIFNPM